jgi:hypothetical protein
MLTVGLATFIAQLGILRNCSTLSAIFGAFTMRLGVYSLLALFRTGFGFGPIGRLFRTKKTKSDDKV